MVSVSRFVPCSVRSSAGSCRGCRTLTPITTAERWRRQRRALEASLSTRLPPAPHVASFQQYCEEVRNASPRHAPPSRTVPASFTRRMEEMDADADAARGSLSLRWGGDGTPGGVVGTVGEPTRASSPRWESISEFRMAPREVKAHLDKHVISQDEAKRALAVAVCDHYNFARRCLRDPAVAEQAHLKPNIMLLGPSGSGKTHLMRSLAKLLGVPFVKADATKFSATGYVGGDVEDTVRSLVPAANGDVALAEYGIVYLDEVHSGAHLRSLTPRLIRIQTTPRSIGTCLSSAMLSATQSATPSATPSAGFAHCKEASFAPLAVASWLALALSFFSLCSM